MKILTLYISTVNSHPLIRMQQFHMEMLKSLVHIINEHSISSQGGLYQSEDNVHKHNE